MMPDHLWSGRLESKPTNILNLDVALTKKSDDSSMQSMRTGLDPALLDPHTLQDEVILEIAIGNIEDHLSDPVVNKDHLIDELLSRDSLFEFVFSRLSSNGANVLKRRLLETFPTAAAQFQKSVASKVLARLSLYFWALSYPADHLKECHRAVDLAAPVLSAISMLSFVTPSPISPIEDEIPEELEGLIVRRKKQGTRKNARRAPRSPVVDSRPFHNIDVDVPQSDAEARELAVHLLEDQMHILQSYFDVLRNPELSETFKAAYIPQISPSDSTTTAVDSDSESASGSTAHEDEAIPSAFPMVQPMKAALYFDSADGFGDWRILISTRADRNLREAKRRDQNLFRIIIKKIKELSNGHFSDDNQKRLSGSDNDIPIYEAKMTRDTRLVYHIDCIKEFENDVEWQVIRIFGIYTHSQLDKRFWEAVGIQLAGKGKEYRKRCVFRNTPHHPGDKVFSPASFPAQENTPLPPASLDIPDLRNEDREEASVPSALSFPHY
ncbi:hypothetical protein QCA50_008550 [Cerrena zonata]|uniref:Uncharacterized protein n=1 Tax=Cerrena zonata TaxID=2478898 RepID=A0AAW0GGQ1_9APHY